MILLQLAAAADTLIVRQVPAVRSGFEQFVLVASGFAAVLAIVLLVVAIRLLLAVRAKADDTRAKLDALLVELHPLTRNANAMVEEVTETARSVNEVVARSRETIAFADERVRKSVTLLADRVDDVSALVGRVHGTAKRVESVATTTVAGIKFGARALGLSRKRKKKKAKDRKKRPTDRPRLRRAD